MTRTQIRHAMTPTPNADCPLVGPLKYIRTRHHWRLMKFFFFFFGRGTSSSSSYHKIKTRLDSLKIQFSTAP